MTTDNKFEDSDDYKILLAQAEERAEAYAPWTIKGPQLEREAFGRTSAHLGFRDGYMQHVRKSQDLVDFVERSYVWFMRYGDAEHADMAKKLLEQYRSGGAA